MKKISVINQKGGVGKTTFAIHFGAYLAKIGHKVLIIDFDPQTNLSQGYKLDKAPSYSVLNFLKGDGDFKIYSKAKNLYILSGSLELDSKVHDRQLLKQRLLQLKEQMPFEFDYVVIDCQPQPIVDKRDDKDKPIPMLNELALIASDFIIVPLEAAEYSIRGLENFIPGIIRIKDNYNSQLSIGGIFFNKVMTNEINYKFFKNMVESSAANPYFLDYPIRKDVKIEEAVKEGKTIFQLDANSRAANDFKILCEKVLKRIN